MTEILWDGKKVEKLEIYSSGETRIWFRATFTDGETVDSYVYQGST